MSYRRELYFQSGRGFAGFLKPLFSKLIPMAVKGISKAAKSGVGRSVAKAAKKAAKDTALSLAADTLRGENIGQSLHTNLKRSKAQIADAIEYAPKKPAPKRKSGKIGRGKSKKPKKNRGF